MQGRAADYRSWLMNIPVMLRHAAATSDEPSECSSGLAAISTTGGIFSLDAVFCQRVLCTLDKPTPTCKRSHPPGYAMHAGTCNKLPVYHIREERGAVMAFPAPRACRKACFASSMQLLSKASHIKRRPFLGQRDRGLERLLGRSLAN